MAPAGPQGLPWGRCTCLAQLLLRLPSAWPAPHSPSPRASLVLRPPHSPQAPPQPLPCHRVLRVLTVLSLSPRSVTARAKGTTR